jgi:hypothetical protein
MYVKRTNWFRLLSWVHEIAHLLCIPHSHVSCHEAYHCARWLSVVPMDVVRLLDRKLILASKWPCCVEQHCTNFQWTLWRLKEAYRLSGSRKHSTVPNYLMRSSIYVTTTSKIVLNPQLVTHPFRAAAIWATRHKSRAVTTMSLDWRYLDCTDWYSQMSKLNHH